MLKNHHKPYAALLAFLFIFLVSCGNNTVYEEYVTIEKSGWEKFKPVVFEINAPDTISSYDLFVHVRNNNNYPYSNLYLLNTVEFPDGYTITDTLNYLLAQPNGKWVGKGVGALKSNKFSFRATSLVFPEKGIYKFTFWQAMRQDTLEGIEDMGLSIEKAITDGENN